MKKAQVHLIVPWEAYDRMILTSAEVAPDGAYRLTLDRTGTFMVFFTGVDHLNLEIPLFVDEPREFSISARLRSLSVPPDLKDVGIIGDFNAFSKYASVPMDKRPDGSFSSELETKAPTFAYQIMGPFGRAGKLMAINGTQSDDYVFDRKYLASYRSVIKTPHAGKIRIVFRPGEIVQCPSGAEFRFEGDPLPERFARIALHVEEGIEKIRSAKAEEERSGREAPGACDAWSRDIDSIKAELAGEKEPILRQALLIGYLRLAREAGVPLDPGLCRMAFVEIPPSSTLWTLGPWVLRPAGLASGGLEEYDDYLAKALRDNPDPNLKAALIYAELQAAKDPGKAGRLLDRLVREYPNSRFTAPARTSLSPDKKILVGNKAPAFSLPALDDPGIVYTNDSLKGKYILIDFWATWCIACVGEMENVHKAYARFKDRNFEILSLSLDAKPQNIALYRQKKWPMPWLHAFLEGGSENPIAKAFEVDSLPRVVLVDPEGTIVALGEDLNGSKLGTTLSRFLGKPGTAAPD
jgi:peroxiredoxin